MWPLTQWPRPTEALAPLFLAGLLQACSGSTAWWGSKAGLTDEQIKAIPSFEDRSLAAFQAKVHPWLRSRCSSCHDSSNQDVAHPHSDPRASIAHGSAKGFVDFVRIQDSRFLFRIAVQEHGGCAQTASCAAWASDLEPRLAQWKELRGVDDSAAVLTDGVDLFARKLNNQVPNYIPPPSPPPPNSLVFFPIQGDQLGPDARISARIYRQGDDAYLVAQPRLIVVVPAEQVLIVRGLRIRLNGVDVTNASTFSAVEQYIVGPSTGAIGLSDSAMVLSSRCENSADGCEEFLSFRIDSVEFVPLFPRMVEKLNTMCSSCHSGPLTRSNGTTVPAFASEEALSSSDVLATTLGSLVMPGVPENSRIMQVLTPSSSAPLMPPESTGVSPGDRESLAQFLGGWIQGMGPSGGLEPDDGGKKP